MTIRMLNSHLYLKRWFLNKYFNSQHNQEDRNHARCCNQMRFNTGNCVTDVGSKSGRAKWEGSGDNLVINDCGKKLLTPKQR